MEFYAGALLFTAATRAGKSTTALALMEHAAASGVNSFYRMWDESGTPNPTPISPLDRIKKLASGQSVMGVFDEAIQGPSGAMKTTKLTNDYLELAAGYVRATKAKIGAIDSLGSFLSIAAGLLDVPAQKGGMVEGYKIALKALDDLAYSSECCFCLLLNETLFSVSDMAGVVDGKISMISQGSFSKHDRADRSEDKTFVMPIPALEVAIGILEPGRKINFRNQFHGVI